MRVVGAGLGRTGTMSLQVALQQLLGGPCYHMTEVFAHPEHVAIWTAAFDGAPTDWESLFSGYAAAVDWPTAGKWEDISRAFPDAPVVLSTRESADVWWASASRTIFQVMDERPPDDLGWQEMAEKMLASFTPDWRDESAAKRAYEAHNAYVRKTVPASRLVDWQPGDGWGPLCRALGMDEPSEPFPHTNTSEEFRSMAGLD